MRLDTPYENKKLEAKRQEHLRRLQADAALKRDRRERRTRQRTAARDLTLNIRKEDQESAARLAQAVERSKLLDPDGATRTFLPGLRSLIHWHARWLRDPLDWRPASHNARRQFSSLLRHLMAHYEVPAWFDEAFLTHSPPTRQGRRGREQRWFVHVARGGNLRTAPELPFALTRKQAHHAMAAAGADDIVAAFRWGQTLAAGGSEALARAVCGSRLGNRFGSPDAEGFWQEVIAWLCRAASREPLFAVAEVGPLLDYLENQKFTPQGRVWQDGRFVELGPPQPDLSMKGRTLPALLRQVRRWHAQLGRGDFLAEARRLSWSPCGIPELQFVEGTAPRQRLVSFVELLSGGELIEEGRKMRHCVGSYARMCSSGSVAIYSLRVDEAGSGTVRRLTLEVLPAQRQIVQARGRCNALPSPLDFRWLRQWAAASGLSFSRWVMAEADRA